jgi:hypothetical protein
MGIESVRCPILQATITRVTDFEGATIRINCPEYEEHSHGCRLKKSATQGGPLSELLERASQDRLDTRSTRCDFC